MKTEQGSYVVGDSVEAVAGSVARGAPKPPYVPQYLRQVYWWAYVHPRAVQLFEREWLVNLILFGNYGRLRNAALNALMGGQTCLHGRTLQVACVYGDLTPRLTKMLSTDAELDVVDILPVQLSNLRTKLKALDQVHLLQCDSAALPEEDGVYHQTLLFFLLHEQPEDVRRATLAEALRVTRPGGKVVIVDYHKPVGWHPLRLLMKLVFNKLEPYAMDLWNQDLLFYLPGHEHAAKASKTTFFGGLYQMIVLHKN